jgi:predicted secreted Zn-dependent protease
MFAVVMSLLLGVTASVPSVVERSEYYEVVGSSPNELRAAIDHVRPTDPAGEPHDAVTSWDVRWQFRLAKTASGCAVTSFGTSVEIVTTLPRWSNRQAGSALAARWDKYLAALESHEREHVQITLRATRMIHEQLSQFGTGLTCALLEESINAKGHALLDELASEHETYDRRTRHGASQGVRFP